MLKYAGTAALILAVLGGAVIALVRGAEPSAVWLAAGLAWPAQVVAFWAVLRGREGPSFMIGWGAGIALRFGVVAVTAIWLRATAAFDAATTLVSLVGFMFVLVLLEPLFLGLAD